MESDLRNILRSVCTATTWKYAIFWKLKSLPTPILTSEDAFYENSTPHNSSGYGSFGSTTRGHSQNDQLGLCVAKMSCQVYSLGEGIIGKAAATGEYHWIHAKRLQRSFSRLIELSNGLLGQISAGIRTVVVIGIPPFAAVQLGSLHTVDEDVKFVSLLREAFVSLDYSKCGRALQNSFVPMERDYVGSELDIPVPIFPEIHDKLKVGNSSYMCISQNQLNMDIANIIPANERDLTSCCVPTIDFEESNNFLKTVESWRPTSKAKIPAKEPGSSSITENSGDYGQERLTTFSAGYELHEALGPAFMKRYVLSRKQGNVESEPMFSNACQSDVMSEKSVSPVLPKLEASTSCVKEGKQEWSNSTEACGPSTFSEAAKSKKRARSGDNCRQRPRDRQLIQDRIKELREIVPNGSKCSIDSLLERTLSHMLFLESITKHAEKLSRCAESKEVGDRKDYEQGSSWALEVGGHFKVSSVLVENANIYGQLMVEIVCEECSHFLDISQAIRGLGLTILKGVTEGHGVTTWLCFVVEGQNNQTLHRRDVLCSLLQALQFNPPL